MFTVTGQEISRTISYLRDKRRAGRRMSRITRLGVAKLRELLAIYMLAAVVKVPIKKRQPLTQVSLRWLHEYRELLSNDEREDLEDIYIEGMRIPFNVSDDIASAHSVQLWDRLLHQSRLPAIADYAPVV